MASLTHYPSSHAANNFEFPPKIFPPPEKFLRTFMGADTPTLRVEDLNGRGIDLASLKTVENHNRNLKFSKALLKS